MIAAFDTYIKYVPDSPELVKIKYRKARIYYEYNHCEEALPPFQEIVEKYPNDELAEFSANIYLDSLKILGRDQGRHRLGRQVHGDPEPDEEPGVRQAMVSLKIDGLVIEGLELPEGGQLQGVRSSRCWPRPSRCRTHPNTPSGCTTPVSVSRTRASSVRRSAPATS